MDNLLRIPKIIERTGIARSTIYALMKTNAFPKPIKIGVRAVAWVESDIDMWIRLKKETSMKH